MKSNNGLFCHAALPNRRLYTIRVSPSSHLKGVTVCRFYNSYVFNRNRQFIGFTNEAKWSNPTVRVMNEMY